MKLKIRYSSASLTINLIKIGGLQVNSQDMLSTVRIMGGIKMQMLNWLLLRLEIEGEC